MLRRTLYRGPEWTLRGRQRSVGAVEFNLAHALVFLSALLMLWGAAAYIRDTLAGRSKPNRVTWSMWALAPFIGTGAAISSGADPWATARIFLAGFAPLLVFLASFLNPQGYWKLTRFDLLCGCFSLLALVVWVLLGAPRSAILLAAIADGVAAVPTIVKAWKYPETETGATYLASFLSVAIVVPSIPVWNIENSAFQVYLLVVNLVLLFCIYRHRFPLLLRRA